MIIRDYFYNEENGILQIDFSNYNDGDDFYRILVLQTNQIQYYSPLIINDYDLNNLDQDFIIELLEEYLKENDLPEQLYL